MLGKENPRAETQRRKDFILKNKEAGAKESARPRFDGAFYLTSIYF
jgi:hypothetical protein